MPIFKMARETPKEAPSSTVNGSTAASGAINEKPLPANPDSSRPGTSGTEMLLVTKRRHASERYQAAARAERTYKAKKRSAAARRDYASAREHFRAAARHLGQGIRMTFSVLHSAPYVISEKTEARRQKADESRKAKALEKKKRLEEQLAKEGSGAAAREEFSVDNTSEVVAPAGGSS